MYLKFPFALKQHEVQSTWRTLYWKLQNALKSHASPELLKNLSMGKSLWLPSSPFAIHIHQLHGFFFPFPQAIRDRPTKTNLD